MDPHAAMFRRLLSVFSSEAAERIHRVNGALLALEREDETTDRTEALTTVHAQFVWRMRVALV